MQCNIYFKSDTLINNCSIKCHVFSGKFVSVVVSKETLLYVTKFPLWMRLQLKIPPPPRMYDIWWDTYFGNRSTKVFLQKNANFDGIYFL